MSTFIGAHLHSYCFYNTDETGAEVIEVFKFPNAYYFHDYLAAIGMSPVGLTVAYSIGQTALTAMFPPFGLLLFGQKISQEAARMIARSAGMSPDQEATMNLVFKWMDPMTWLTEWFTAMIEGLLQLGGPHVIKKGESACWNQNDIRQHFKYGWMSLLPHTPLRLSMLQHRFKEGEIPEFLFFYVRNGDKASPDYRKPIARGYGSISAGLKVNIEGTGLKAERVICCPTVDVVDDLPVPRQ